METESALLRLSSSAPSVIVDVRPLLSSTVDSSHGERTRTSATRGRIHEAAHFFGHRASPMRESSMLVRETAAEQLEERQTDWAYSRPVVALDLIWNLAFVLVSIVALMLGDEQPCTSLRVWILGYAVQCVLHMSCVVSEYKRRRRGQSYSTNVSEEEERVSLAKRLESANTMFSFVWWIIGFYWIAVGSETHAQSSPRTYWLCVIFLAFDVFFVVFCVALACLIGIAICCCLPCIIGILYAVTDQEGASEQDINKLPRLNFTRANAAAAKASSDDKTQILFGFLRSGSQVERSLSAEDAECCICLCTYDDGVELRELPCGHHFHGTCIEKWLRINATCPLCKYNIVHKTRELADEEV